MDWYCAKPGTPKTKLVCQLDLEDALGFERMGNDSKVLPLILRELDRMPTRIRRTMDAVRNLIQERMENDRIENERNEPNFAEPEQIEDLAPIPNRPASRKPEPQKPKESNKSDDSYVSQIPDDWELDPAVRTRLQSLPGNYLWNLLLHYTFEDYPDELAHFYSELEREKAEIEAAKLEQEKYETNPIAA